MAEIVGSESHISDPRLSKRLASLLLGVTSARTCGYHVVRSLYGCGDDRHNNGACSFLSRRLSAMLRNVELIYESRNASVLSGPVVIPSY